MADGSEKLSGMDAVYARAASEGKRLQVAHEKFGIVAHDGRKPMPEGYEVAFFDDSTMVLGIAPAGNGVAYRQSLGLKY